jgi:hypothetical protein
VGAGGIDIGNSLLFFISWLLLAVGLNSKAAISISHFTPEELNHLTLKEF